MGGEAMSHLERIMLTGLGRHVARMLDGGCAPSEIDRRLGLADGRARDLIVDAWHRETVAAVRARARGAA